MIIKFYLVSDTIARHIGGPYWESIRQVLTVAGLSAGRSIQKIKRRPIFQYADMHYAIGTMQLKNSTWLQMEGLARNRGD